MHHRRPTLLFVCRIAAAVLMGLAASISKSLAQGVPPLPYLIPNACQRECCRLGEWSTSFSPVLVHTKAGALGTPSDTIPVRSSFTADSTAILVRHFGIAVVDTPVPRRYRESPALAPGDTVYLLRYEGEDWFTALVRGQRQRVYAFWAGRPGMSRPATERTFGRVIQDLDTEWWVHVRLRQGRTGWIDMTRVSSVHGPDACSE